MAGVVICVPWRPGSAIREALWVRTQRAYARHGLPIVTADSDPARSFNLSQARNRAMAAAGDWDVAVVTDADTVLVTGLDEAIAVAQSTGALVYPVSRYWRLDEHGRLPSEPERFHSGGVHVWGRAAWLELEGYDERFDRWGGEDSAALFAAHTFGLYHEVDGDAVHLYHPRAEVDWMAGVEDWPDAVEFFGEEAPPGYGSNGRRPMPPLVRRYADALDSPAAMRALLDER